VNRNLKFAIGQFVVFMAAAGLCLLVAMPLVMGVMLLAALVSAHGIYKSFPRKAVTGASAAGEATTTATDTRLLAPQDITRDFLIKNDGKFAGIRWDGLSMRGYIPKSDVETQALLDRVVEVKVAAEAEGIVFTG
jgi:hypothetical protein